MRLIGAGIDVAIASWHRVLTRERWRQILGRVKRSKGLILVFNRGTGAGCIIGVGGSAKGKSCH